MNWINDEKYLRKTEAYPPNAKDRTSVKVKRGLYIINKIIC